MRKVDIIQVFERLEAAYGERFSEPSDLMIDTWFEAFERVDSHYIIEGTKAYIRESRFAPTPHDILSSAKKEYDKDVEREELKARLIAEGFSSLCSYYPGAYQCDSEKCREVFTQIVFTRHESPQSIANEITEYVREMELAGKVNDLKPLNVYLKEKLDELT